jgi:hypothetical protein
MALIVLAAMLIFRSTSKSQLWLGSSKEHSFKVCLHVYIWTSSYITDINVQRLQQSQSDGSYTFVSITLCESLFR